MEFRIAVIKGDGIGPEVVDAACAVLDSVALAYGHTFALECLPAGGAALAECGEPLPKRTVDAARGCDAILLGAVGDPAWDSRPPQSRPERAILGLREAFGLYANLRPVKTYAELASASPLRPEIIGGGVDMLIVRELTGGIYFGPHVAKAATQSVDGGEPTPVGRFAYDVEQYSEPEIERIARRAFEAAMARGKRVASIDKANVLASSRLWRAIVDEVSAHYPEVALSHMYVDNAAQQLIMDPRQFDVILTSNLFGDILSDEASQITGSIGMLPSASLGDGGFGLYEPIHGSAPGLAGRDEANPIATILAAALMLRHSFGLSAEAQAIERAVQTCLSAGFRTPDIAAKGVAPVGTKRCGGIIAGYVQNP